MSAPKNIQNLLNIALTSIKLGIMVHSNTVIDLMLALKMPIMTAADDIHK